MSDLDIQLGNSEEFCHGTSLWALVSTKVPRLALSLANSNPSAIDAVQGPVTNVLSVLFFNKKVKLGFFVLFRR